MPSMHAGARDSYTKGILSEGNSMCTCPTKLKCAFVCASYVPLASTAALAMIIPSQDQETCMALGTLASDSANPQLACTPNDDCNQVACQPNFTDPSQATLNTFEMHFNITLLPCEEPDHVAVKVVIFKNTTQLDSFTVTNYTVRVVIFPDVITGSLVVPVVVMVNLTQITDGIELEVSN